MIQVCRAPHVVAVLFGAVDFSADVGCAMAWEPLLTARSALAYTCGAAGVALYDGPELNTSQMDDLAETSARAKALGFTGRACIHPRQVAIVNAAFTPSPDEISHARRVIQASEAARGGVAILDGQMIDAPVVKAAHRTLAVKL